MNKEDIVFAVLYGAVGLFLYIVGALIMWSEAEYPGFDFMEKLESNKRYQLYAWLMLTPLPILILPILIIIGTALGAYDSAENHIKNIHKITKVFVNCLRGKYNGQ